MSMWNKRSGIMLAYPFSLNRLRKNFSPPYLVQPKLNGERCRIIKNSAGAVTLLSSEENEILGVPHIREAFARLPITSHLEFDGELYVHGKSLQSIRSIVSRRKDLHPDHETVTFNLFDIVINETQYSRLDLIYSHLKPLFSSPLTIVETTPCNTYEEIYALLVEYMKEGYEGVIVRDYRAPYVRKRSTKMLKWKPRKHDCYKIVEVLEAVDLSGAPKNTLGALTLDSDGGRFNCGAGMLTHEQRDSYWETREDLIGLYAVIKYPELTERGVPSHPVLVEISNEYIGDEEDDN